MREQHNASSNFLFTSGREHLSFRIRGVHDDFLPVNRRAIGRIISFTSQLIPDTTAESLEKIRGLFANPVSNKMQYYFFIAENNRSEILEFAQMSFALDLKYSFLDPLASNPDKSFGGVGGALYKRVRDEAIHLNSSGLFVECLSDSPESFTDISFLKRNRGGGLKFYEGFGARPVASKEYASHTEKIYGNPYFIVYDSRVLGTNALSFFQGLYLEKYSRKN